MFICINFEDVVANALIAMVELYQQREVSFRQLNQYGAKVIEILNAQSEQVRLTITKDSTSRLLDGHPDIFEGLDNGIRLKDGVSVIDLWVHFRGHLSVEVMKAFIDKKATNVLRG